MKLSEKIKLCRNKYNMTQDELSQKLNVSRKTISNWENERSFPDIDILVKISEIFNVSLDDLLKNKNLINHYVEQSNTSNKNNKILKISYYLNIFLLLLCYINLFTEKNIFIVPSLLIINMIVLSTHFNKWKIILKQKQEIETIIISFISFYAINFFATSLIWKFFFKGNINNQYKLGLLTGSIILIFLMSISFELFLIIQKNKN